MCVGAGYIFIYILPPYTSCLLPWTYITSHEGTLLLIGLKSPFWVELLFVIQLTATHTVYLVWLHLKLGEQVLAFLSRDVVFENSEATRAPNADVPVIFLSLAFCRRQKLESQISFFRTLSLHKYSLKLCTCVLFIYVYMKVTRPRIH
jgi:hypothetical protein